jgi:hypothetical protein
MIPCVAPLQEHWQAIVSAYIHPIEHCAPEIVIFISTVSERVKMSSKTE